MLGITLQETRFYQEAKEEGRQEGRQEGQQEGRQEGQQEGRQEEGQSLVLRLLRRKVGDVPEVLRSQIDDLSLTQLEFLGEALLDFTNVSDLEAWLAAAPGD